MLRLTSVFSALIMRNNNHTGPIKGLHFNPKQPNLLASGGPNGEVYIWDMNNPTKPYSPGARSSKLDEITSLSWNGEVAHILATSSSSGYTVVWDLKNKKELTALTYGGGSGTAGAPNGMGSAFAAGVRRGMGAVCWHPEQVSIYLVEKVHKHSHTYPTTATYRPPDWRRLVTTTLHL